AVGRVTNLHPAGFDDVQVDVRLTGPKDDVAVGVVARLCQGFDERQLGAGQARKGGLFRLSHGLIPFRGEDVSWKLIIRLTAAHGAIAAPPCDFMQQVSPAPRRAHWPSGQSANGAVSIRSQKRGALYPGTCRSPTSARKVKGVVSGFRATTSASTF